MKRAEKNLTNMFFISFQVDEVGDFELSGTFLVNFYPSVLILRWGKTIIVRTKVFVHDIVYWITVRDSLAR